MKLMSSMAMGFILIMNNGFSSEQSEVNRRLSSLLSLHPKAHVVCVPNNVRKNDQFVVTIEHKNKRNSSSREVVGIKYSSDTLTQSMVGDYYSPDESGFAPDQYESDEGEKTIHVAIYDEHYEDIVSEKIWARKGHVYFNDHYLGFVRCAGKYSSF